MDPFRELTWIEIYYQVFPHLKKDKTFTAKDVIRFYENNLDPEEMQEVRDYFGYDDDQELPYPTPPVIPFPVPFVPPALLPPEQKLVPPPNINIYLLPVWPFIVPKYLPYDLLKLISDFIGPSEAGATILNWQVTPLTQPEANEFLSTKEWEQYSNWWQESRIPEEWEQYQSPKEEKTFYDLLPLLEIEAARLEIVPFEFKFWVISDEIKWYVFDAGDQTLYWTLEQLPYILWEMSKYDSL